MEEAGPEGSTQELRQEVSRLQGELDQMSARMRHAYAQVESSQAMITAAQENGALPSDLAELHELRQQVEQLRRDRDGHAKRALDAEERAARARAELAAFEHDAAAPLGQDAPPAEAPNGSGAAGPVGDEEAPTDGEGVQAARSLRARLTDAAARKKAGQSEGGSRVGG